MVLDIIVTIKIYIFTQNLFSEQSIKFMNHGSDVK